MKAFVTGGTGFIGSHLVDRLIADNSCAELLCLIRSEEKWLEGKSFTPVHGDLQDKAVLKKAVRGADVIFHIAGRVKAPTYEQLERANVEGTKNLLEAAQEEGVSKMIILSSLAAAGPSQNGPVTEAKKMIPISNYGKSKKRMEEMVRRKADDQMSLTILRPPAVYGPREDQIYSFFRMNNVHLCPILGDGKSPKISMIYVKDVVNGIMKAREQSEAGIHAYFISGPSIYTWNNIREATTQALGKKNVPIYIKPKYVLSIAKTIEKISSYFGVYPVLNTEKAMEMILKWTCSDKKAQQELGYKPQYSLQEGIQETITWYKEHRWL